MSYVAQRLLTFPLILIGVSILVFFSIRLIPGDAITAMLGTEAGLLTTAQRASLAEYFGIDQPVHVQYWRWFTGLFQGDLGISVTYGKPVLQVILERFPLTLELALLSMLIALSVGIPAGVLAATRSERPSDLVDPHPRHAGAIDAELRDRAGHHLRALGLFRLRAGDGHVHAAVHRSARQPEPADLPCHHARLRLCRLGYPHLALGHARCAQRRLCAHRARPRAFRRARWSGGMPCPMR